MRTFVKICGICSRTDLNQICTLDPDAVGFVFWPKSKRYVRPFQIAGWVSDIPDTIKKVGVFVEPTADEVEAIARECQLDAVQIHLKSNTWKIDRPLFRGLEVWLSPRMDESIPKDLLMAVGTDPSVLLADSFDPEAVGGTGKVGNWDRAKAMKEAFGKPLMLAGGLTPDNVGHATEMVRPWGVDVSSGVEIEPGVKDIAKIREFIFAARF